VLNLGDLPAEGLRPNRVVVLEVPSPVDLDEHVREHPRVVERDRPKPEQHPDSVLVGVRERHEVLLDDSVVRLDVPARGVLAELRADALAVAGDVQVSELRRVGDRLLENETVELFVERGLVVAR